MPATLKRGFKSNIIHWLVNPEGLIDSNTLLKDRVNAAKPSLEFFTLLITSSVIATIGLIDNSAAVVIGAMIIALLMDPIISLAFAIANRNIRLAIQSTVLIALGEEVKRRTQVLILCNNCDTWTVHIQALFPLRR